MRKQVHQSFNINTEAQKSLRCQKPKKKTFKPDDNGLQIFINDGRTVGIHYRFCLYLHLRLNRLEIKFSRKNIYESNFSADILQKERYEDIEVNLMKRILYDSTTLVEIFPLLKYMRNENERKLRHKNGTQYLNICFNIFHSLVNGLYQLRVLQKVRHWVRNQSKNISRLRTESAVI